MIVQDYYHGIMPNISNDMLLKHIPGSWQDNMSNAVRANITDCISIYICPLESYSSDGRFRVFVKRPMSLPMMSIQECEQIASKHLRLPIKLLKCGFTQATCSNDSRTYFIKKFNQNKF